MLGTFAGLGFTLPRWQGCDVHDVVAETDITMGQPRSDGLQPSNDGLLPRLAASGVASQHVDELEAIAAQIHYISQCARRQQIPSTLVASNQFTVVTVANAHGRLFMSQNAQQNLVVWQELRGYGYAARLLRRLAADNLSPTCSMLNALKLVVFGLLPLFVTSCDNHQKVMLKLETLHYLMG